VYKVGVGSMPSWLLASPFETLAGNGKVEKLTNIFQRVETTNQICWDILGVL
jgi:glutamate synthase domain-containing protein 1